MLSNLHLSAHLAPTAAHPPTPAGPGTPSAFRGGMRGGFHAPYAATALSALRVASRPPPRAAPPGNQSKITKRREPVFESRALARRALDALLLPGHFSRRAPSWPTWGRRHYFRHFPRAILVARMKPGSKQYGILSGGGKRRRSRGWRGGAGRGTHSITAHIGVDIHCHRHPPRESSRGL